MSSVAIASAVSVARPQFVRFLSAASVARKADLASFLQKEIDGIHESVRGDSFNLMKVILCLADTIGTFQARTCDDYCSVSSC